MQHTIVAYINLIVGLSILVLVLSSIIRIKHIQHMFTIACSFASVAVIYVVHGAIEVYMLGEIYYALSAVIATLVLGFSVFLLNQKHSIKFGGTK